jgi:hypothetical protein
MTAAELQVLIPLCAANGVTQLEAGPVKVTFKGYRPAAASNPVAEEFALAGEEASEWFTASPPPTQFADIPADEAE